MLNDQQRRVVYATLGTIALMMLYAPWYRESVSPGIIGYTRDTIYHYSGYDWLWDIDSRAVVRKDILFFQTAAVALIGFIGLSVTRTRHNGSPPTTAVAGDDRIVSTTKNAPWNQPRQN